MFSHGRVLRADIAKAAPPIHSTRLVILRPMIGVRERLSRVEPIFQIYKPFVDEVVRAIREPPSEAGGEFLKANLSPFNHNPLHLHIHHYLPGEGVEGHLVVGGEAFEPVIPNGALRGLVIHNEDIIVYRNDTIKMTTEKILNVGIRSGAKVEFELE